MKKTIIIAVLLYTLCALQACTKKNDRAAIDRAISDAARAFADDAATATLPSPEQDEYEQINAAVIEEKKAALSSQEPFEIREKMFIAQ